MAAPASLRSLVDFTLRRTSGLPGAHPACQRPRVIRRRLHLLLVCALAILFSGCATSYTNNIFTRNRLYRKIHITDLQGYLIADWIAEGPVWRHAPGYRFKAVERRVGGPIPVVSHYPHGRKVIVNGPNIVVMPCEKPEWLRRIDGF